MHVAAFLVALLLGLPAVAQERQVDPRLATAMTNALQALLALREAELAAVKEDMKRRIADLEQLCGEPCKPKAEVK